MALTSALVNRILSRRVKLRPGIPATVSTAAQRWLHVDLVLARWRRLGDPGRHSG